MPRLHRGVPGRSGDRGVLGWESGRNTARSRDNNGRRPVTVHRIEAESYRILAGRVDLSSLAPGPRAVVGRVIHASADVEYAATMVLDGRWCPGLVVGMPVGFVGAAEAKQLARDSRLPSITNVGEKGGSAVAAAVVNALGRLADGNG